MVYNFDINTGGLLTQSCEKLEVPFMKKVLSMLAVLAAVFVFAAMPASASTCQDVTNEDAISNSAKYTHDNLTEMGFTEGEPVQVNVARLQIDVDPEIIELAYSEIDENDPGKKMEILKARNVVANSVAGWYDDLGGCYAVKVDTNTMTWHELPKYSELFPGWDLPKDYGDTEEDVSNEDSLKIADAAYMPMEQICTGLEYVGGLARNTVYHINAYIPKTKPGGAFAYSYWEEKITNNYLTYLEVLEQVPNGDKINLGVTDISTAPYTSIYAVAYLENGQGIDGTIPKTRSTRVGFRGSCNAHETSAKILLSLNHHS